MSQKELKKQSVLLEIDNGSLTMVEGAKRLGLSLRQLRRSKRRYENQGLSGLVHRGRGKPSGRSLKHEELAMIKQLLHERYPDFGSTFAAEKLSVDLERAISKEKIRQIQIEEGLHRPKKRRNTRYHPRRKRRSRIGELIQSDGSIHRWLEDRGEIMTLITFIDDATSRIMHAEFVESESTHSYMRLMKNYVEIFGRPRALYVDKHNIFRQNKVIVREKGRLTNFGKALREIDIELICAHSPQAKGRVERGFGTLQDRLIKEMRLANIQTMEEANQFLPSFLKEYNEKFTVLPGDNQDAHRPVPKNIDLRLVFTNRETRELSKNLTFQYECILYQVLEPQLVNRLRNQKVEIRTSPMQEMKVISKWNQSLRFEVYEEPTKTAQRTLDSKDLVRLWRDAAKKPNKYHPWR